jgi:hypothetical protein
MIDQIAKIDEVAWRRMPLQPVDPMNNFVYQIVDVHNASISTSPEPLGFIDGNILVKFLLIFETA